jgi:miniconductance mechanosensitive channel
MDLSSPHMLRWLHDLMLDVGFSQSTADNFDGWLMLLGIILSVLVINAIMRRGVIRLVHWMVHRTKFTWDEIIFDDKVMSRFCNILMPIIFKIALPSIIIALDITGRWLKGALYSVVDIWTVIAGLLFVYSLLRALYELMERRPGMQGKPIRGILQTCQVILLIIGLILIISILINKSPILLLTGLGASAAVRSFIFKDSLMGLIAGIQLSLNDMLKVGDWIEMPSRGIDGIVEEVTLTTIKIRAWNNTLQTIPPYLLISEPFDNWQAMFESGGRRIKRSLNIDITSLAFADDALVERLRTNDITREIMDGVATETIEGVRLTNVDIFIRCINRFIDKHPRVNHDKLAMVRQLQPTEWGLPIELYFFTKDVNWVPHEHLQTEIVSHVLALAPLFDIRIYQAPTTMDLRR